MTGVIMWTACIDYCSIGDSPTVSPSPMIDIGSEQSVTIKLIKEVNYRYRLNISTTCR